MHLVFPWHQELSRSEEVSSAEEKQEDSSRQTFVILPGPHKTGSTSIQAALYKWFNSNHTSTSHGWAYPLPAPAELEALGYSNNNITRTGKGFSPMVTRLLFANPAWNAQEVIHQSPLLQLYQRKIKQAWERGQSIVIASEHLDRLMRGEEQEGRLHSLQGDAMWERFLAILPTSANLIIGVVHRTPRIEHLLSLWHHVGHEPLAEFITKPKPPGLMFTDYSLNSLGLAEFFVKRKHRVRILDSGGGREADGLDLPEAVACHLLRIPHFCNNASSGRAAPTKWYNARPEPAAQDLDNQTLQHINRLLLEHDCQYRTLQADWVYTAETFVACNASQRKSRKRPFSQTTKSVVDLVCRSHRTRYCKE